MLHGEFFMMKFSFLAPSVPGPGLEAQCEAIRRSGCQGVEALLLPSMPIEPWAAELRQAASDQGLEIPAVIVGGLALFQPGQLSYVSEAFEAIHELGAGALVTPEYRPQDPLPLLPPYPPPSLDEQKAVDEALEAISEMAAKLSLEVYFEPITPFQSRFWRNTDTVLGICKRLNNPHIGLALDFWVMNITDASIPDSIRRSGEWVHHIHLADNNRLLPGQGHIDFAAGLHALREIGYSNWYSYECAVPGDFIVQVSASIERLRGFSEKL
jgi:sugar phosphate isomerase/epimerase